MAFGASGFGQTGSTLFGASQPSLFGNQNQSTGLFGNTGLSAPAMSSSAFGQAIPSANSLWGNQSGFGGSQQPAQGSRAAKWQVSQIYDNAGSDASRFHSISAMEQFREFSAEELRVQDYARGDKGGPDPPGQQQGGFGAAFGAQSQSGFGSGFGAASQSSGGVALTGAAVFGGTGTNTGFGAAANSGFGTGASNTFGAGSNTGFGNTGFGAGNNSGFGAAQNTGFGAAQNTGFGAAQNPGFGAAQNPGFGAAQNTGFGATQNTGFGATQNSGFGAAANTGFGAAANAGFGSVANTGFGAAANTGFGAGQNTGLGGAQNAGFGAGAAQSSGFGANAFGAGAAQSSGFGAVGQSSAFGASVFGASSSGFAGPQSGAASLFGSPPATQPTGAAVFGGGASQQQPASSLFGAPSSSALGAAGAFGSFGGATAAQTTNSLFGGSTLGGFAAASGAGTGSNLFGNTGTAGFGNTGSGIFGGGSNLAGRLGPSPGNLFGSNTGASVFGGGQTGFGSGLGSSFGAGQNTGFAGLGGFGAGNAQQQQQGQRPDQGPLQASLAVNPFGESKLFTGLMGQNLPPQSGGGASVINTGASAGLSQGRPVSVIVGSTAKPYRRTRNSEILARQTFMRHRTPGRKWFAASPMAPWGEEGPVFNIGSVLGINSDRKELPRPRGLEKYTPQWRTAEQKARIAGLKRLVIDPMPDELPASRNATGEGSTNASNGLAQRHDIENGLVTPAGRRASINPGRSKQYRVDDGGAGRQSSLDFDSTVPEIDAPNDDRERRHDEDPEGFARSNCDDSEDVQNGAEEGESSAVVDAPEEPQSGATDESPGRYVPYSAPNPFSGPRRRPDTIGGQSPHLANHVVPKRVPKCTKRNVQIRPSLEDLSRMSDEELSCVVDLCIREEGIGEITWLEPIDVRGLDFDDLVHIKPRELCVYPRDDDVPAVGQGLNKPAIIKLFGILKIDKHTKQLKTDATTAASMVAKLKAHCEREGLQFLGYDIFSGTWTFQANSF